MSQLRLFSSIILTVLLILRRNNATSDIHSCKAEDKKCIIENIQKVLETYREGNRDWNLAKFDPLHIKEMVLERRKSSPVNIELKFSEIDMIGLSGTKIEKIAGFDNDPKTSNFEIYGNVPNLTFSGPYSIDGKVLILPIVGKGQCKLIFENIKTSIKAETETIQINDKTHLKIKKIFLDLSPSKSIFYLENLFNGDKALGDNMNKFINDNWKEIFNELKPAITKAIGMILLQIANGPLQKTPYNDMIYI